MRNAEVFCPTACFGGDFSISSWFLQPATSVILLLTVLNFTSSQSVALLLQRVRMQCRDQSSLRRDGLIYLILHCHSLLLTSIIIGKIFPLYIYIRFSFIIHDLPLIFIYIRFAFTSLFGLCTSHLYLHPISIDLGFTSNLDLHPISCCYGLHLILTYI